MTYAAKVAADGAIHHWPLADSGTPVTSGTPSASAEPFGSSFNAAKVVDGNLTTGWAISAALCNGSWWRQDWGSPVTARGVRMRARDSSNATIGTDDNPVATVDLSDSTSLSIPAIPVNGEYYLDFGSAKSFTWLKVTFNGGAPGGGNPGWSDCRVGGDQQDVIGTHSVTEHSGASGFTYAASGPSSISGSGGVTIPATEDAYLFGLAPAITVNADRSLEWWHKTANTTSACPVAFGDPAANKSFAAILNTDGATTDDLIMSSNNQTAHKAASGVHDGSYHHCVITYTGSSKTVEFYFDGASVGTQALGSNLNTLDTLLSIGDLWFGTGFYLDGTISNVAVYSSVLNSTQVADHALGDASGGGGGGGAFSQAIIIA